jgi:hypothetical protein
MNPIDWGKNCESNSSLQYDDQVILSPSVNFLERQLGEIAIAPLGGRDLVRGLFSLVEVFEPRAGLCLPVPFPSGTGPERTQSTLGGRT